MRILGIDYGRKKVGLALGVGSFAEPLKVIRFTDFKALHSEINKIIKEENVDKLVVGVSENEMGEESREFAQKIGAEVFDETLTSQDAQRLSREANVNRKKRKEMEDAYAACIMLQNYLDSGNF